MFTRRHFLSGIAACACTRTSVEAAPSTYVDGSAFQILCGIRKTPAINSVENLRPARPEAERIIDWICGLIGVRPEFELLTADFKYRNIAIAATRGDRRYVIYDDKWFRFEENKVSWYTVYVFGHEIGHHLHGHTFGFNPDRHRGELDADRFGGWVVARLGGRLEDALAFMPSLSEKGGKTHPPRNERIIATRNGWLAGSATNYRR